jgi:5-methylcytosine-specific restriction enzyme subunit McrC
MLDEVPLSGHYSADFSRSEAGQSRLLTGYNKLLKWARVFLLNESFTNFKGAHHNKAILFPMEKVFEDFVSYGFRRFQNTYDVSLQDRLHHLVYKHGRSSKFALKPDIVLRDHNARESVVIDCKWKLIAQDEGRRNYNIAQSDMYQLYAYGKKYVDLNCQRLILLYPMHEKFREPLAPFYYEESPDSILKLYVVPVDLDLGLNESISQILNYIHLAE